jgi:hypothetical protein
MRDEEFNKARQQIAELTMALEEAEDMEKLHLEQEKVLKEEIRQIERKIKREDLAKPENTEYLKNVVFKFLTSNEREVFTIGYFYNYSPCCR